jgi:alpha-L-rhamnosidase
MARRFTQRPHGGRLVGMPIVQVAPVRFEHHPLALGIGERAPRLSWRITAAPDGWRQAAYEVDVDSVAHRVRSVESVLVTWPAAPLTSRDRRSVRVPVRGVDASVSDWSPLSVVEAGFAGGFGLDGPNDHAVGGSGAHAAPHIPTRLRRGVSARLYATAYGLYQAEINARKGSKHKGFSALALVQMAKPVLKPSSRRPN